MSLKRASYCWFVSYCLLQHGDSVLVFIRHDGPYLPHTNILVISQCVNKRRNFCVERLWSYHTPYIVTPDIMSPDVMDMHFLVLWPPHAVWDIFDAVIIFIRQVTGELRRVTLHFKTEITHGQMGKPRDCAVSQIEACNFLHVFWLRRWAEWIPLFYAKKKQPVFHFGNLRRVVNRMHKV